VDNDPPETIAGHVLSALDSYPVEPDASD